MVVDDSRLVRVQLEDTLKGTDYEIAAYCRSGEEAIEQYTAAIASMEERRQSLLEEIESEHIREVTKLLKEKNMSVEQLKSLLGDMTSEELAGQGA